nr:unnamed protein product [Hydra vulgaris]
MDFLTYNVSRKLPVDVLFLDFAKAFDKVPHRRLLQKLESYGIEGNVLNWIKAFLSNRSQRVILGNTSSTWVKVTSGVPQGSVLGPMLFIIFINDLPEHINSENLCKMYADNTKILSVVKTTEDKAHLQSDIDSVVTWTRTWLMELNNKKCKVMHFIPSVGPVITDWYLDEHRPREAVFIWNPIPNNYINGRLLRYKVSYGISRDGKNIFPPAMIDDWVDSFTTGYVIKNLSLNAEYTVYVAGETIMGTGSMSNKIYIESCKCPSMIYTAWYQANGDKYLLYGSQHNVSGGIMYDFLNNMTKSICTCNPGLKSGILPYNLYWDRTKDGKSPMRANEDELKALVDNNVHFHLPVHGKASDDTFQSQFKYVQIANSPGIAFIVLDQSATLDKSQAVATAIFSCWPAIIIIFLCSTISGIFIWVLDCKTNKAEFPNESFTRGILHGVYWAFVSMTTIGYGDKTPRSTLAKVAAIIWLLTGPIINAIVIGAISTNLTSVKFAADPILYGSEIGALSNSCEYELGVRRNAKMIGDFKNANDLLDALFNGLVHGVLLDSVIVTSLVNTFAQKKFKIVKIIPVQCGWGVVLSSDMIKVEKEIRSYVGAQAQLINNLVNNLTKSIT